MWGGRNDKNSSDVPQQQSNSEENKVPQAERPEWQNASSCGLCSTVFTLTTRRHHCRNCGVSICKSCTHTSKKPLPQYGFDQPVLVCCKCFPNKEQSRSASPSTPAHHQYHAGDDFRNQGGSQYPAAAQYPAGQHRRANFNHYNPELLSGPGGMPVLPWSCSRCTFSNPSSNSIRCGMCGAPYLDVGNPVPQGLPVATLVQPAVDPANLPVDPKQMPSWNCLACTFANVVLEPYCKMCQTECPAPATWDCTLCTLESAWNCATCSACGTARPAPAYVSAWRKHRSEQDAKRESEIDAEEERMLQEALALSAQDLEDMLEKQKCADEENRKVLLDSQLSFEQQQANLKKLKEEEKLKEEQRQERARQAMLEAARVEEEERLQEEQEKLKEEEAKARYAAEKKAMEEEEKLSRSSQQPASRDSDHFAAEEQAGGDTFPTRSGTTFAEWREKERLRLEALKQKSDRESEDLFAQWKKDAEKIAVPATAEPFQLAATEQKDKTDDASASVSPQQEQQQQPHQEQPQQKQEENKQSKQEAEKQPAPAQRQGILYELLDLLGGDEAALKAFMSTSVKFNKGQLPVDEYYDCVLDTFGGEDKILVVLPKLMRELAKKNRGLALALRDVYLARHRDQESA